MNNAQSEARHSNDFVYSLVLVISLILMLAVGGLGYWYFWMKRDFSAVYTQLGITPLPVNVELDPEISKRLEQLNREPCYKD